MIYLDRTWMNSKRISNDLSVGSRSTLALIRRAGRDCNCAVGLQSNGRTFPALSAGFHETGNPDAKEFTLRPPRPLFSP